jgi:Zn-dependent peptidase ImmA (M78 family)/DNA-binding XRE family transcriptional regulator
MDYKQIFGRRLKSARLMKRLTMEELAQMTGNAVSKPNISKYEAGKMMPSSAVHIALAQALGMDFDYFFRPVTLTITRQVDFRKKSKLSRTDEKAIGERVKDKAERYMEIEDTLGVNMRFDGAVDDITVNGTADVKHVADRIRHDWNMGMGAVPNVIDLLEAHQIRVMEIDAPDDFDGECMMAGEGNPFIVLNGHYSVERKRFTAMHELGHVVMRFGDEVAKGDKEKLCQHFANEMLLSGEVLRQIFGRRMTKIYTREVTEVQTQFGISNSAIIHRLNDEGIISDSLYRQFNICKNMNKKLKAWVNQSTYLGEEKSYRFSRMVYRALAGGLITESKANEILGTDNISYIDNKEND